MTAGAKLRPVRWFHLLILALLLAVGGWMRASGIDRQSLSLDEYWALYLATGRGQQVFQIPYGSIVDSPPHVAFNGAPPWWKIWTGLGSTTHPPLYFVVLRWWVDLFGQSDRAIRTMSLLFGLAAAGVLFDAVRRGGGPWRGLLAAGFMGVVQTQIDFSQMARPYAMMEFFGVCLCDLLIATDHRGPSFFKSASIAVATCALALTHYFSAGAILGAAIYAACHLNGRPRKVALMAMAIGVCVAGILWGPVFWKTRHLYDAYQEFWQNPNAGVRESVLAILQVPVRLLLDPNRAWDWLTAVLIAALIYIAPLFRIRQIPENLLWWLWIAGTIAVVTVVDLAHRSTMVSVIRYDMLASPAVYAILSIVIPHRLGMIFAALVLFCAAVYGVARVQIGPESSEDWKTVSHLIDRAAGPRDVTALLGFYQDEPSFDYFVMTHYVGDWNRPVIFLMQSPSEQVVRQLAARPRVWIVGHHPDFDTNRMLPGWRIGTLHGEGLDNAVWAVLPPAGDAPR
jgi:hypothetical protein